MEERRGVASVCFLSILLEYEVGFEECAQPICVEPG